MQWLDLRCNELRPRVRINLVVCVRREHQYAALANVVALVANDLDLGGGDGSHWVTVVWVTVDQDYMQSAYDQRNRNASQRVKTIEGLTGSDLVDNSLVGLQEVRRVVDELTTLAIARKYNLGVWALRACLFAGSAKDAMSPG